MSTRKNKINEVSQVKTEIIKKYEERIKNLKNELTEDLHEKVNQYEKENKTFDNRIKGKPRIKKSRGSFIHKLQSNQDHTDNAIDSKHTGLELTENKLIEGMKKRLKTLKRTMSPNTLSHEIQIQELDRENKDLKARLVEAEKNIFKFSSNYEKDKALWANKFDFLENQKQQAKQDLQDAHLKFEMTIEQLHVKVPADKPENDQLKTLSSVEKKYNEQIKDIHESYKTTITELNDKYKRLETKYKEIYHKYKHETSEKLSDYEHMKSKIKDLEDNEIRLMSQVKNLEYDKYRK